MQSPSRSTRRPDMHGTRSPFRTEPVETDIFCQWSRTLLDGRGLTAAHILGRTVFGRLGFEAAI